MGQATIRVILYGSLIFCLLTPIIDSDGYTYYAITRSFAREGNLVIHNDPIVHEKGRLREFRFPDREVLSPIFSGGFALGYAPFLILIPKISLFQVLAANLSVHKSEAPRLDSLAISIGSLFFSILSLIFLKRLLEPYSTKNIAAWTAFLILAGTPLLYYTFIAPSFAHAIDTCMLTSALYWLDKTRYSLTPGRLFLLSGMAAGWSGCIRNINFIFLPVFCIAILSSSKPFNQIGFRLHSLLLFCSGIVPFALFQLFYNHVQYGSYLRFGYQLSGIASFQSHLIPMLFSATRGYFTWTPICLFGCLGLLLFMLKDRWLALVSVMLIAVFFSAAQFFPHWWGGVGFGLRFATLLAAPIALGTAELFNRSPKLAGILASIFVIFTFSIFISFTGIQHTETGLRALEVTGTKYNPFHLIDIFIKSMKESTDKNPIRFIWNSLSTGHVPALFPNLLRNGLSNPSVFVLKLKGIRDPQNPEAISGELKVWSRTRTPVVFSLSLWTYFTQDTPNEYPHSGKSRVFSAPLNLPDGMIDISWTLLDAETLMLTIPENEVTLSIKPVLTKPGRPELRGNLHLEAGLFVESVGRFLPLDIRSDTSMQSTSDEI